MNKVRDWFYSGPPDKNQKMRKQLHQQELNGEVIFSLPGKGTVTKSYQQQHTTAKLAASPQHPDNGTQGDKVSQRKQGVSFSPIGETTTSLL